MRSEPPAQLAHTRPRRLPMIPDDTVVPAQSSVSVHPSAQCIPHVGQTQSVWCRSTVHPHVTNRSDGRPGPLVVHR
ncbi:hypothetical protein ASD16_00515 [Cellulomonas sp. Root485]|nr:hypothetical protein ASD16_00515 [Cellulomonas sp. Root485]